MDTTRRYPRSMLEAFGAYRDENLTTWEPGPKRQPLAVVSAPRRARWVIGALVVIVIVFNLAHALQ